MRTIDWDEVKAFIQERKPVSVDAGILNDWFWTADTVYQDGEWREDHGAYVESAWACPGFKAYMPNGDTIEVSANREMTEEEMELSRIKRDADMKKAKEALKSIKL